MNHWTISALPTWPHTDTPSRKTSQFRTHFEETLTLLLTELDYLDAELPIEIGLVTGDGMVRKDGMLAARATVFHPGVQVTARTRHGLQTWATDAFTTPSWRGGADWHHNLRAVALGLQSLRAVDRYGITDHGQQYAGFKAIGAGEPSMPGLASTDEALRWLSIMLTDVGLTPPTDAHPAGLLRMARAKHHPDRGGDPEVWARIDESAQLLQAGGLL